MLERVAPALDRWRQPTGARRALMLALIGALLIAVYLVVHATGGTKYVYAHLGYLPILAAAFVFGLPGGVLGGLLVGLLLGPLMPLDVAAGTRQSFANWSIRLGFFTAFGGATGLLCSLLSAQLDRVRWQARHDPVSGQPNKQALLEAIAMRLEAGRSSQRRFAVLALHALRFEETGAAFGHHVSDALLAELARRLARALPPAAVLHHLAGADLAMLHDGADCEAALALAGELQASLRTPFVIQGIPIAVQIGVGIACHPGHGDDAPAVLRAASFALRNALSGERAVAVYDPEAHRTRTKALRLITELRVALDQDQLGLAFQPKIALISGACAGVEVLARWQHPTRGPLSPAEFVATAERTAMMRRLTAFVLDRTLRQYAAWRASGLDLPVAVNISVRNLEDPSFPRLVADLLAHHAVAPERLELEITESAVMADPEQARAVLAALKGVGARIAIDDFGTGHACLAQLLALPVDVLKVDRSFVQALDRGPRQLRLLRAMVELAHDLDLTVVAEGIEDRATAEQLRRMGCDLGQGYAFARPLPADALVAWHRDWSGERLGLVEGPGERRAGRGRPFRGDLPA